METRRIDACIHSTLVTGSKRLRTRQIEKKMVFRNISKRFHTNLIFKIPEEEAPIRFWITSLLERVAVGVGVLACWGVGVLACWGVGVLACWGVGVLGRAA